jgi:hypothetical protein
MMSAEDLPCSPVPCCPSSTWPGSWAWHSLASGKAWPITKALAGAVIFAAILAFVVRPLLNRYLRGTSLTPQTVLLVTVVLVFGAAWFTSDIGLYTVFGAFSVGLVMPPEPGPPGGGVRPDLVTPTMGGISAILVPMFFTYSGLNTRFALLTDPRAVVLGGRDRRRDRKQGRRLDRRGPGPALPAEPPAGLPEAVG